VTSHSLTARDICQAQALPHMPIANRVAVFAHIGSDFEPEHKAGIIEREP